MPRSSFVVQVSGNLPPHALDRGDRVQRHTVLGVTVRDQAALYGLLKVLNDLGLDLLAMHQLPDPEQPGPRPRHAEPWKIEVVVRGSIGDLAMTALCDHADVTHVATRLVLDDRRRLDQVLEWAHDAAADIEYVGEPLLPSGPPVTPASLPSSGSPRLPEDPSG